MNWWTADLIVRTQSLSISDIFEIFTLGTFCTQREKDKMRPGMARVSKL